MVVGVVPSSHHPQTPGHSQDLTPPQPPYPICLPSPVWSWALGETTHPTAGLSFWEKSMGKTLGQTPHVITISRHILSEFTEQSLPHT